MRQVPTLLKRAMEDGVEVEIAEVGLVKKKKNFLTSFVMSWFTVLEYTCCIE